MNFGQDMLTGPMNTDTSHDIPGTFTVHLQSKYSINNVVHGLNQVFYMFYLPMVIGKDGILIILTL